MVQKELYDIALDVGLKLNDVQIDKFNIYYQVLSDWNTRINLTSIEGEEQIYFKHFWDSLNVCSAISVDFFNGKTLLDVGSGGGFPGLPLAIVFPQNKVTLLESRGKKVKFLNSLLASLDLPNVSVVQGRAEDLARVDIFREKFDVVLSRALGALPISLELTLPFCCIGGVAIFYKGKSVGDEVTKLFKTIDLLGGCMNQLVDLDGNGSLPRRIFVIIEKCKQTPEKFPRRSGIPQKHPLVDPLVDKYLYDIK